ncbi:MAG TPA: dephospho-CoA kinase [Thermoleophilaceae bacterium]|nr:dephospho-CoA kinase [Thermoleophilaceae bacterium]
MAPFVGLTGGLGAGKSEALRLLGELGAATLSTDHVVHELLATDELRELVAERLGADLVADGALDRSKLAERVFGDDEARSWLERELWPRVGQRVARWRADVGEERVAIVEVPLLFESGMETVFDATIAVVAAEDVRAARAAARGHALVEERVSRQLSQSEKAQRADFTVKNDGTIDELRESLSRVLAKLDQTSR